MVCIGEAWPMSIRVMYFEFVGLGSRKAIGAAAKSRLITDAPIRTISALTVPLNRYRLEKQ
jgi:hypothetical protein